MADLTPNELLIRIDERVRGFDSKLITFMASLDERLKARDTFNDEKMVAMNKRIDDLPQWRHLVTVGITAFASAGGWVARTLIGR